MSNQNRPRAMAFINAGLCGPELAESFRAANTVWLLRGAISIAVSITIDACPVSGRPSAHGAFHQQSPQRFWLQLNADLPMPEYDSRNGGNHAVPLRRRHGSDLRRNPFCG